MKKQLRARGGGAESTPQKDSGSPQSSPPSSERVQPGLGKFFGTGSQNKRGAEKPVSEELVPQKKAKAQQISAGCHEGKE